MRTLVFCTALGPIVSDDFNACMFNCGKQETAKLQEASAI